MAGAPAQIAALQRLLQNERQAADDARQAADDARQAADDARRKALQESLDLRKEIRDLQDEVMDLTRKLAECEAREAARGGSTSGERWWMGFRTGWTAQLLCTAPRSSWLLLAAAAPGRSSLTSGARRCTLATLQAAPGGPGALARSP